MKEVILELIEKGVTISFNNSPLNGSVEIKMSLDIPVAVPPNIYFTVFKEAFENDDFITSELKRGYNLLKKQK